MLQLSSSDPASVAYKALEKAVSQNKDVLIIDTAGRLQNQTNLMSIF
jgi:fused signal recognition particle receptor